MMVDIADEFYLATGLILGEKTAHRVAAFIAAREAAATRAGIEAAAAVADRYEAEEAECAQRKTQLREERWDHESRAAAAESIAAAIRALMDDGR